MPFSTESVTNSASPQVFSGPRALFRIDGNTVGYASGVSGEEQIQYEPVTTLDLLQVKEYVPVGYQCSLNAQMFRVVGQSIKARGYFPALTDIITGGTMTATIVNSKGVEGVKSGEAISTFTGVRCTGHSWDVSSRGLTMERVGFVATKHDDESDVK